MGIFSSAFEWPISDHSCGRPDSVCPKTVTFMYNSRASYYSISCDDNCPVKAQQREDKKRRERAIVLSRAGY